MRPIVILLLLASAALALPFGFWKPADGGAPDETPPTLASASINGSTLTLNWDEAVTGSSTYLAAFDVDMSTTGADIAVSSHTSGNGTDTWVLALASPAVAGETVDLDYAGGANLVEDAAGNDLAAITSAAVTNTTGSPGTANLAAWWKFNDASGNFADAVGANALTANGTPVYSVTGQNGDAVTFDGSTEWGQINVDLGINTYPFSVSGWFKTSVSTGEQFLLAISRTDTFDTYYGVRVNAGKLSIAARNGSLVAAESAATVSDNTWRHFVAVFTSATDRKLYLDGNSTPVATSTTSVSSNTNANTWAAGALIRSTAPSAHFNGSVDDFAVWTDALTTDEVAWLFANSFDDL